MYVPLAAAPVTAVQARSQLPACYSQEFHDCIDEYQAAYKAKRQPNLSSYCAKYHAVWFDTPKEVFEAALDDVPFCSQLQIQSGMGYGIIGAALVAGVVIGFALKG